MDEPACPTPARTVREHSSKQGPRSSSKPRFPARRSTIHRRFTVHLGRCSCCGQTVQGRHELQTSDALGAVHFPQRVITLFTEAIHLGNEYHRGHVTLEHLEDQREAFDDRLLKLASVPRAVPAHQTFANHLMNHFEQWFAFVFEPKIEPTNWPAEQAIRPAVVNRKVWGGNRTVAGGAAQSVLMSVIETARRGACSMLDPIAGTLRAFGNSLLPRPVLLTAR